MVRGQDDQLRADACNRFSVVQRSISYLKDIDPA